MDPSCSLVSLLLIKVRNFFFYSFDRSTLSFVQETHVTINPFLVLHVSLTDSGQGKIEVKNQLIITSTSWNSPFHYSRVFGTNWISSQFWSEGFVTVAETRSKFKASN
jgi:hypothetical protein